MNNQNSLYNIDIDIPEFKVSYIHEAEKILKKIKNSEPHDLNPMKDALIEMAILSNVKLRIMIRED